MSETVLNKSFHDAPWKAYETQFNDAPWKRYTQQVEEQKRGRMETWRRIRDSFAGDEPLSFVPDEKRQELEEVVSIMENPELEKKKLALAAYYSGLNNQDFPFVYSNIEQACEIANGEKTTVDRAYASIREYLRGGNDLPGNLDAYKLALEQYEKNHQGFWKGIAGATKNIYWGNIAYLSKLSSWLAWDILGDQGRVYDEAAVKNAQDGFERIYSKRSADINAVRRKAFGIEKQPFILRPDSDLKTSFAKQNQLGIYELPFKPAYKKGIFGDKTLDEENRKIDENYLTLLRKYPDRYGYVPPEAKTYFDAEKAFWLEVERKYKEKYGETAFANAISAFRSDENNIHRKADFSSKHLRSSMQDSRYVKERIKILQNHFEEKLQENRTLYHPGNVETDDLGTLVKNGEYSSALGKGLAIVYDQFTESVLPMAAMAFITGGSSAVPEVAGMKSLGSAALQVGGKAASLGSFAGAMKAEGEKNIFDLNENATAEEIDAYATRHMLYEVLPEYLFGWFPIFKKLAVGGSRKLYKSFWSGVADYGKEFVKGGAKDSFGEFLTFTAEKFDDAMQGFGTPGNKKLPEMSKEEFSAYYMNGFPEMLLGAFFSAAPVSALAHVPQRKAALEMQKATERAAGIIESRIAELAGKETLSEGEKAEFEGLSVALDSGDMRGVFNAAQKLAVEEAIHTEEKYTEEGNRFNDFPDADEEAVANAQLVAPVEQLREKLQHDPADSEAAVNRLRGMFQANIRTTEKWMKSQLAPLIERTMQKYHLTEDEAFEYCSARVPALWVHGEVILNTRNIRPFEVPFKLAHEVALHEGIRKAFGDDAANSLFDMVWKECQNTELMQKILKDYQILKPKYSPDGKPVTDEDGNPIYLDLSQNEQREAAEEFLAHLQETNGVPLSEIYQDHRAEIDAWGRENGYDTKDLLKKEDMVKNWMASTGFRPERPGWLKQIIAQVRIWLHKHGWFVQHLSDDDIQTILAKSAEAVSNSKFKAGNIRYSVENAMPSKAGFTVERINENAGQEFNEAKGVIAQVGMVYKHGEVPAEQPQKWLRQHCVEYAKKHHILGDHETPALGDGVKVSVGSVKAVLNHPGSDVKNNLIAVIPEMLKNAVFIQAENNGKSKTYLLASKVRYGEKMRFIVGMVIHENNGKYYYDHEFVEIENAEIQSSLPGTTGVDPEESASVLTVIQNALFARGFDKKSEKNSRFSVLPKDENLVVVHNLSASKLRNAAKLGGLPVPSLAIIDAEKSDFTNYGEISLIADKDLIDPKYRSNRVYNADIYSARAPRKRKFYSDSDYDNVERVLSQYDGGKKEDEKLDFIMKRFRSGMYDPDTELEDILRRETYAALNWFCSEHGMKTPEEWQDQDKIRYSEEFKNWWETDALPQIGLNPEEKMYAGSTNSGRQKWIPLTLENVVKAMTKKVRNSEGFFYGIGNIRSLKAKQFKSITQIQKQRDHIVSAEKMQELKSEIEQEFTILSKKMEEENNRFKYGWEYNSAEDCMMAMAEGGYENSKYLHDRFGDNQELFQEMAEFLDKLVNMPTEYFEAKPQRAVWLDEFKAAVIPDDAPADVRKLLEDAGLQIYTYGKIPRKAALQMATMDKKVRFAIDGAEMDSRTKNLITMMRPIVGEYPKQDGDYYAKQMRDKFGVHVDSVEAWVIAIEAVRENQLEALRRGIRLRNKWLYENFPLYREVVDFCGENFIIKPAYRFTGEKFSGSWISPEFVKYSEKRPQGKSESDSSYRRYLARREIALRNATGHDSDEIAEAIARKWGRDALDVEQELIEFFRDLSKKEFYHNYTEWKQENIFADKQAKERAKDEWMKQEQAKIEDEVVSLLEHGKPISEEWVRNNRKIYQELYRQLFPGKDIPYSPGKADLEAINAALIQEGENASTYAQAYKAAREKAFEEFMNRLSAFRDKVMKNKSSAVKLQRDALDFAEKNLQPENRGEFARNIVSLLEYSTAPSGKYPEGRRMHEFRNLFDRIVHRASEVRKTKGATAIKEMLDAARIKRNYKGIPTSILPSEQAKIDRIRQVVNMNLPTLLNAIEYNNQKIMELEGSEENDNLLQNFLEDNRILETFGNLENKTADETEAAARMLESIIRGGKAKFKDALTERKAKIDKMRTRAVNDATFGKNEFSDRGDAKKHRGYWLKNESLGTLMRIASGKSIQDFENSVGGELYKKVEDSTQEEQTRLRHLQEDFDSALRNIVGISGNKIQSMREKGKFFRMLSEVVEHTGVFKMEYSRTIKTGPVDFVFEHGRRGLMKKLIPVEDYEWNGKMRPGARSLLKRIDNGEKVSVWQDMVLDDVSIAFLRQQLADYDAGLKQAYEIFNDESDDANFNRMIEDERKSGKLILFSHIPDEVSKKVEIPLSQGAALQILLTWEQEHYQPNMKWNGWSEESIEQLKKFLKPEVLKMGYWMRDQIAKNKADLDKKVFERYGAHLPLTENYFPAAFRGGKTKSVQVESELGRGAGSMSINPNFLIARKFHLNPVDTDADAFSSFLSNQVEQAHFIAWSDTVRDLKAVYGGRMVQKAIADKFGKEVVNNLVDRVATIARGGGQFSGDYAARLMTKLYRYWIPAKIALNPSSFIKQIFGTVAYMNHVPVKEFVTYFAKANFSNPDYRAFVAWAKKTDYMKNRLAGGLDKDLSYLMNYTRDSKAYSPWSDALMNIGTWGTRWSDAWSTLHGGYAAYMYALDQARAAGYSESDAREAARRAWMRATDETQQSGYLKDQNYFQSNQGAFRYLTAFMTNPIQIMNLQLQTINEIRYGSDKKSAWKKLGRQILVNHLIVPTLMQFTTDMLRNGFNLADWWDELQFEDYLLAWMMGSFESMFLFGKLISNLGGYTLDRIFGRKAFFMDSISAMPLADDLQRDIGLFFKLAEGEKPLTEKELMDAIKAFGDIGMVGGIWDGRLGTTGAILHAIGAQGKRIFRWIDDDK